MVCLTKLFDPLLSLFSAKHKDQYIRNLTTLIPSSYIYLHLKLIPHFTFYLNQQHLEKLFHSLFFFCVFGQGKEQARNHQIFTRSRSSNVICTPSLDFEIKIPRLFIHNFLQKLIKPSSKYLNKFLYFLYFHLIYFQDILVKHANILWSIPLIVYFCL